MNNKKIFEKIITEKRAKSSNERPKYGLRKLTVGVVSCLLGYMMFFTPNVVAAEKVDQPQAVEATVESTEVANTENVEEESEQPKEETAEIAETEKPVSHVEAYSSNAKETNAQERTVRTTAEETSEATTEETAEKTTEFKLTEEQKKQLFDAGFDEEQIQKIENDIKLELEKDANYDVEKHIKDAIEKLNQPELTLAPKAPTTGVRDAAPPEDTDTTSDAKNAVHGYVGVQVGDDVNKNLAKADKGQFIPMEGVRVYFQWFEKKGNRVSPVYAATSDASGQFHMKIKPYIGDDGKLVKFDADTTSSAGTESYKFWVDKSTIPAGYQLQYSTGESVEFNAVGSPGVPGVAGASSYIIPNKLTDFKVLLMEIPKEDLMHKEATPTGPQIYPDPVLNVGQGAVRGKVSWDYESAGGIQWGIVATHTSPAPDVKVRASYLSDYALKQIFSAETANMLSLSKPSDIRGSGWTFALEKQLQDWIKEQVAKEPDKWIAETVSAVTNAEGDYKIQFNGTWGPERNGVNVAEYTAPKGWTQEQKDRLGTVAKNATDGSFLTGALDKNEKHVNSDWLFISAEGTDKLRVMTPWNNNWYTGSNNAWGIHGGWAQAAFGVSTVQAANSTRADFALAPAEIKFNITNYDTGLNTATPGDEAKTETKGLPYKNTSDSFRIVWYDAKGNVVKTETATKPNSTGDFPEATYDTTGVTETTTFTAKLYRVDAKGNNGQLLAQDSFTVKISKLVVSAHDEVNIPNPGASDDSMKGATYSAEGLPKGLTIDPNNGTISGKATKPGKYTVTIKTSVPDKDSGEDAVGTSQYVALVTDSPLKDGNVNSAYSETIKPLESEGYVFKNVTAKFIDGKAIDGLTIAEDQISGTPTVKVEATQEDPNVEVTYDIYKLNEKGEEVLIKKGHVDRVPLSIKDGEATNYEPKYEAVDGKVGTEATVKAPTFTDKDGNPATPENVTYELGEGAPTGAKVNADGSVTYTPVDGDAEKAVKIPVVVKYSDGSTDNVNAVINVSKKSTTADKVKELGGVKPQTIKVWKGDDIDWRHGVIPADGTNSDAVRKLLEAATITDNGGRNSNEAGKSEGTLKVTFTDGSFIEVPKQMLTVSDHIVTIDPNDPNSPSKDDLPRDSIEVRFVASTGVKEVKTTGTTYVKPGITFKDTDFPQVTFEDGYKAPVTWTPENRIIDIDKPGYNKRGYFRFTAKATLEDIIDRTNNPDAPTPDGYVRVTFKNGDGVNDIANNKVYDVKIGTKLTADKYPTVTAKDGYENPTWSTPAGTAISKDNATITATATKVKETSAKPKINDVTANDPTITGTGVPGSNIVVTKGEDIIGETTVNDDGTWSVKVPDGTTLAKGDELVVTQTEKDKKPADATTTVGEKTPEAPAAPKVEAKDDGSVTVTPPTDEDTKTVEVTYTPEGKDTLETVVVTKGEDGTWSAPEGSGLTVDPATGIVTIPADKVKDETEVTAIAKDNAGNKSKEGIATAGKNPVVEMTEAPKINQPKSFDTTVTGTATPGAKVEVTLPNGEKKTTTADQEGNWTVETPKLEKDTKITAKATEEGKKPSEETKQTVAPWSSLFTAEGGELVVSKGKDVNAHDVYKKVKLIFKENNGKFVVGEDNRILLPIGNDSHAWLYVDPAILPTKDNKVGQYTQNVTITYPDGSKQIVKVVVKVVDKTDADKYEPTVKKEEVEKSGKVDLTDNITNLDKLPKGTTVKDVTPEGAIDTNTPGDYTGKVEVTYPDGSKETVEVPVTVTDTTPAETDADKYEPTGKEVTAEKDSAPKAEDAITNKDDLPKGTKYEWKETPDTSKIGETKATVVVTYPDGSTDEVEVKITVTDKTPAQKDADKYEPTVEKETVKKGGKVDLTDNITNLDKLPKGTTVKDVTPEGAIDTNTPGDYTGKVEVTYPDGSKETVDVPVTVTDTTPTAKTDAEKNPAVAPEKTEVKDKTALTPEEKKEVEGKVKTANPKATKVEVGNDGSVTLTYTDKSTNTLTPEQTVTEKAKTDAEKNPAVAPNKTEVENKDKLTDEEKAKVKDEVKKVNPEAKEVEVDDKGNVSITYPDGSTNTLTPDQTITEKGATDAEKVQPNLPEKTGVKDLDKLTDKEKEKVKKKIEDANKDKFPEGTEVSVDDKGNATITYPDGSKDTIPAEDLVFKYKHGDPEFDNRPELPISDIIDPTIPGKTDVGDKDNLTDKEKEEVKKKIEDANKDKFPEGTKVDVDEKGNATITYPDGSKDTIPADKLVNEKSTGDNPGTTPGGPTDPSKPGDGNKPGDGQKPGDGNKPGDDQKPGDGNKPGDDQKPGDGNKPGDDNKPSDKNIADKVDPTVPGKTKVEDPSNLSKDEKDKVKDSIEKANKDKFPQGTKVEIGKDGSATITYPDGSKDTIKGSDLVEKISDAPTRPSKQDKPAKNLPKAGIESEAMMMAAAALSTLGGLYVSKKKKEDEE